MALPSGWIIIAVIVGILIIFVNLIKRKQAVATFLATAVIIFLVVSVSYVYLSKDIQINSVKDVFDGVKIYFHWFLGIFGNLKSITTHTIGLDWKGNETNSTEMS